MFDLSEWKPRIVGVFASIGVVWGVSLFALLVAPQLVSLLAVVPRRLDGLPGVVGMPFVHDSLGHLMANTVPLIVFGLMLVVRGLRYFLGVALVVALLGGLALWAFGRNAMHIGASGVVFGLFGFLVVRGLYERRLTSIAVTVLVTFTYGASMLIGIVPTTGVSWEAHLFGLLAGILTARVAYALDKRQLKPAGNTLPTSNAGR